MTKIFTTIAAILLIAVGTFCILYKGSPGLRKQLAPHVPKRTVHAPDEECPTVKAWQARQLELDAAYFEEYGAPRPEGYVVPTCPHYKRDHHGRTKGKRPLRRR